MCIQGSRVRPNFSRVRLQKIWGRTGASSHSEKEKKSIRDSVSLLFDNRHVRLISWSKPIRDSEGRTPPLIGRGPGIPVRLKMRVLLQSDRDGYRWVVEMRAALSLNLLCSKWMLHTGGGWGETPPHDCKALWVYNNTQKALYKCIIHSFIQWASDSPSRILRSLNLSQNQANSAIFQIAADFPKI